MWREIRGSAEYQQRQLFSSVHQPEEKLLRVTNNEKLQQLFNSASPLVAASEAYHGRASERVSVMPKNRSSRQVLSCGGTSPLPACLFALLFLSLLSVAEQRKP